MKILNGVLLLALLPLAGCHTCSCGPSAAMPRETILLKSAESLKGKLRATNDARISYYFDHYVKMDGQDYLAIIICGTHLCEQALLHVSEPEQYPIRALKHGGGWRGAELRNLRYQWDAASCRFEFISVEKIID